jgi:hypothetical protein
LHCFAAQAAPERAIALRTTVSNQLDCSTLSKERPLPDASKLVLANRIDALVADAIEDGGLELALPSTQSEVDAATQPCKGELEILALAKQAWVFSPQLITKDDGFVLRLLAASPNSHVLRVATQQVTEQDINVRTIVMVSELLSATPHAAAPDSTTTAAPPANTTMLPTQTPHSTGRAILAFSSAALGGAVGYSLQRAGGSDDPRLTYPLIALGTGIGLGASMIVSDEWDVSIGEAWYLNAGMLWPAASGLLLARAYQVSPSTDRYVYGLGGAFTGIALATFATSMTDLKEGSAAVAHSGGAVGTFLGGLVDMTISGDTDHLPWHGMGFGSGLGVVAGGALATQLHLSSSRVLFIDMAAGFGALTGAAAASPVLFGDGDIVTVRRQRLWLGAIGIGTLAGGTLGWYLTRNWTEQEHMGTGLASLWPYATIMPSVTPNGTTNGHTDMTAGVQGVF